MKKLPLFLAVIGLVIAFLVSCELPQYKMQTFIEITPSEKVGIGQTVKIKIGVNFAVEKLQGWIYVDGKPIVNGDEFEKELEATWKPSDPGQYQIYGKIATAFTSYETDKKSLRVIDTTAPIISDIAILPNYGKSNKGFLLLPSSHIYLAVSASDPESTYLILEWDVDGKTSGTIQFQDAGVVVDIGGYSNGDHNVKVTVKNPDGAYNVGVTNFTIISDYSPPTAYITADSTYSTYGGGIKIHVEDDGEISVYKFLVDSELENDVFPGMNDFYEELEERDPGSHEVEVYVEDSLGRFMYDKVYANVISEESSSTLLLTIDPTKTLYDPDEDVSIELSALRPSTDVFYKIYVDGACIAYTEGEPASTTWKTTPGIHLIKGEMNMKDIEEVRYVSKVLVVKDQDPPIVEDFKVNDNPEAFSNFVVSPSKSTMEITFKDNSGILQYSFPYMVLYSEASEKRIPVKLIQKSISNDGKNTTYEATFDFSKHSRMSFKVYIYGIQDIFGNNFQQVGEVNIKTE